MHASAASMRDAGFAPEQFGDQAPWLDPLGQRVAMTAVRAEHHIAGPQMGANSGRDRFLANIRMAGAVDQPALMKSSQLFFGLPDQ